MAPFGIVEVEIVGGRGFDPLTSETDEVDFQADARLHVAIELVSSATGEPLGTGKQWCSLGSTRLRSFIGARCRDRFALACAEELKPSVRFEVYKQLEQHAGKASSTQLPAVSKDNLVAWVVVAPWLDLTAENFRWVQLSVPERRRWGQNQRPSPRRRELRVSATLKMGAAPDISADVATSADSVNQWFCEPGERVPDFAPNVARLAVIRATGLPAGESCYVAARCGMSTDAIDLASHASGFPIPSQLENGAVSTSRLSPDGIWMQTLTLALDHSSSSKACCIELAVLRASSSPNLPSSKALETVCYGQIDRDPSDHSIFWYTFSGTAISIRLAFRLDYDERLDAAESRPFFREELYPSLITRPAKWQAPNVVRVVVARCRGLSNATACGTPPKRPGVRVIVSCGGEEQKATLAKRPADSGVIIWNECFEFLLPEEADIDFRPRLVITGCGLHGDSQAAICIDAPDNRIMRSWYRLEPTGAELMVLTTRYRDATIDASEEFRAVMDQLALAYPDIATSDIERVYNTTGDIQQTCVALGALATSEDVDDDLEDTVGRDFVAACNATNLDWVVSPMTGHLVSGDEKDEDEDDDGESTSLCSSSSFNNEMDDDARRRELVRRNKPSLVRVGTRARFLSKRKTIKVIRTQSLADFKISYQFKDSVKPALDIEDEQVVRSTLTSPSEHDDPALNHVQRRNESVASTSPYNSTSCVEGQTLQRLVQGLKGSPKKVVHHQRRAAVTIRTTISLDDTIASKILKPRFEKTPFVLDRAYLDVRRTPRDFLTLRIGLLNKLRGLKPGDPGYAAARRNLFGKHSGGKDNDEIPPLPAWVRKSLNIRAKTQRASFAAVTAATALATAIAIATGLAPIIAVSGAVAAAGAAAAGAVLTVKTAVREKIDADLATCTWVEQVRVNLATRDESPEVTEATLFFKLFISHGSSFSLWERPKDTRVRPSGSLDFDALREVNDDKSTPRERYRPAVRPSGSLDFDGLRELNDDKGTHSERYRPSVTPTTRDRELRRSLYSDSLEEAKRLLLAEPEDPLPEPPAVKF